MEPTREEIYEALGSALDNAREWIETFDRNEWNDPNYPKAAEIERRHEKTLKWLRDQYGEPPATPLVPQA